MKFQNTYRYFVLFYLYAPIVSHVQTHGKKMLICIIVTLMCIFGFSTYVSLSRENIREYNNLKKYYKWLDIKIYHCIHQAAGKYNISVKLTCAVIQQESGSYCNNNLKKMVKVKSSAGAIGIMQVMPFHIDIPIKLMNYRTNINKGVWYLSECLIKSKQNISQACRMYNAGINNKEKTYKNWAYVKRIINDYYLCLL